MSLAPTPHATISLQGIDRSRDYIILAGDPDEQVRAIIRHYPNDPPRIFRRGQQYLRLTGSPGQVELDVLDRTSLAVTLGLTHQAATRSVNEQTGAILIRQSHYSLQLMETVMKYPHWPLPELSAVYRWPVLSRERDLLTTSGYHPDIAAYLDLPPEQIVPNRIDVGRAVAFLRDALSGFPFRDEASFAHAIGYGLLLICGSAIREPCPFHVVVAPTPATGKTLLLRALTIMITGQEPHLMAVPSGDDEMEKSLISVLIKAPSAVIMDNLSRYLSSGSLASVLTSRVYSGRFLGKSQVLDLPNRIVWSLTGNGIQMSKELVRRSVTVSLDAGMEDPETRGGFRYPDLVGFVLANRRRLLAAFLTLVQHWINEGRPEPESLLSSHREWSMIIGGILRAAGISGFLSNRVEILESQDAETSEWEAFVMVWLERSSGNQMSCQELWDIAEGEKLLLLTMGSRGEHSRRTRLGQGLTQRIGRVIGGYRICSARDSRRQPKYWLEPCN